VRNSFDEIACVGVVSQGTSPAMVGKSSSPPNMHFPDSEFGKFIKQVESTSEKRARIDQFINSQKQFPVIEGDSLVHIIYRGEARDVALRGDMFDAGDEVTMHRLGGTDFFYASFKIAPNAFLSYQFVKDLDQRIADPRNPHKNAATMQLGETSEIYMPRSARPRHFYEPATASRGRLDTLTFASEKIQVGRRTWGGERRIQVYLPPEYDATTNVDEKYRTIATPEARAILGCDEGGYSALYIGFRHSNIFGKVAGQSAGPIADGGPELVDLVQQSPLLPLRLYLDWGTYDYRYASYEYDARGFGQSFAGILRDKNYQVAGGEFNEGSDYASWRRRTDMILQTFFPIHSQSK
jgi:enterochelin esterase-like enzyme